MWQNLAENPVVVWCAFILAHFWLGALNLFAGGYPLGDVGLYQFWSDQAILGNYWVGINGGWVYPIVAIVPMLIAAAFGPALYASTWLSLIMLLDAAALAVVLARTRGSAGNTVAWWWTGFLVLLGPIALGRIDSVTVPLAIVGMLVVMLYPRVAAVILTVATWIKVWPAALLVALVVALRERWRIVLAAAATSGIIAAIALAFGSGDYLVSFITQQTSRGLQFEAPISAIWLWQAYAGVPGSYAYYDRALMTWQVAGTGVGVVGGLMTVLMVLSVVAIVLLALLVAQRGAGAVQVLPPLSLALVSALIAFNKVGSPQFMTWLAVPVILGLATHAAGGGRSFRTPAVMVAVLALLTQSFYPYLYGWLLGLHPILLTALTVRNALLFVLLGWAVRELWRLGKADRPGAGLAGVWPLGRRHDSVEEHPN